MHISSLVATIGLVGIIALTNVVSVRSAGHQLDANSILRPIIFPEEIIKVNIPLAADVNNDEITIQKLIPENGFLVGETRISIVKWIPNWRPTAFAKFDSVDMILQCTQNINEFNNEYRMNKLLKNLWKARAESQKTAFTRIPGRVISFLLNENTGCTGYYYEGNAKPFTQFINEYEGENYKEVWAELSRQLIEVVALIHELRLVHGDITKNNIFISQLSPQVAPTVNIIGFYNMHIAESSEGKASSSNVSRYANAKNDAWATGMVIYHAIMGRIFLNYNDISQNERETKKFEKMRSKLRKVYGNKNGPKLSASLFGFFPALIYTRLVHATNQLLEVNPDKRRLPSEVLSTLIEIDINRKPVWKETFQNNVANVFKKINKARGGF